jgi:hypothetical protein
VACIAIFAISACGGSPPSGPAGGLAGKGDGDDCKHRFIFPRSSTARLSIRDLVGRGADGWSLASKLSQDQLWEARNEIFARNNYPFQTERAQGAFADVCASGEFQGLNQVEEANVALIQSVEQFLTYNPEDEWEGSYAITGLNPNGDNYLSVRACPSTECPEIGRLGPSCAVNEDGRLSVTIRPSSGTDRGASWVFVNNSACDDVEGPAIGYVHSDYLYLIAG